ncbi:MAG: NAD(P)/FAD-dependent oxidoreductase [Gaiellaceae bacterium]
MTPAQPTDRRPHAVLGAGPAGLTAAYLLARRGESVVVLEAGREVGGLARTELRDGYRFDLGGHRFFTKSAEVERIWHEVLGDELLLRPRLSRIYWRGRFIDYPLRVGDVCRKVGAVELGRCLASYLAARVRAQHPAESFEDWVSARFGRRLFELFFRTYTEKVWGIPSSEIRSEWAAQRIRGLSPWSALRAAVAGNGDREVRSLIDEFHYPRLGPGQMWEAMAREVRELGGEVRLGSRVTRLRTERGRIEEVLCGDETLAPDTVISSLPLRTTVAGLDPRPRDGVAEAARGLRYRDFVCVALVLRAADPFPDNWIYVHDASVRVGRIQNFRAWSPDLVPRADRACVGLEYFCFEGDELWSRGDGELVDLAAAELERLGLATRRVVERGFVVRVPKAYPIYDAEYSERVATIRASLEGISNLEQVGRNGLHRYNNSDHSMLTAIRAVENLRDGAGHDIWTVNADGAYHEESAPAEQPYRRAPETPAMRRPLSQETE